nr:uncharacterized protein LOC119715719 isoform X3 [Anas platyrhynchos]
MRAAGRPRRGVARGRSGRAGPCGAEELEPRPVPSRPVPSRPAGPEPSGMDHFCQQVQQKDVGRRLQVGQELLEYLRDPAASPDVEQDPQRLDKVIDELAAWVNSSNFKVVQQIHHRTGKEISSFDSAPETNPQETNHSLCLQAF